jgi:hypothetical protein
LAPEKTGDSFAEEVEDRLENLFGEDDAEEAPSTETEPAETAESPLRELKAIVLSIDWEITDEVMNRFVEQIAELQDVFKDDRVVLIFLQLLGSIGEYIRVNLGKSHPDAFKILSSLYNNLDSVVHAEGMPDAERRKILSSELAKYKKLKERLVPAAAPAAPDKAPVKKEPRPEAVDEVILSPELAPETVDEVILSPEPAPDFIAALEEFKQLVQTELQALRKEIQELKKALAAKK